MTDDGLSVGICNSVGIDPTRARAIRFVHRDGHDPMLEIEYVVDADTVIPVPRYTIVLVAPE